MLEYPVARNLADARVPRIYGKREKWLVSRGEW